MKIVFDWEREQSEKEDGHFCYLRRTALGRVVAKIEYKTDDIFGNSYIAKLFDYSDAELQNSGSSWKYYSTNPTNYQFGKTVSKCQRWIDENLKHLGYKLVSDKYKVLL